MGNTNICKILSHRGITQACKEENSEKAFIKALQRGFGLETDLRDLDGEVVISHDGPTKSQKPMSFERFVEVWQNEAQPGAVVALNIKSDGLQEKAKESLGSIPQSDYFFFDMSVPDSLKFSKMELPVFCRMSEYEPYPENFPAFNGIWLDAFESIWYELSLIKQIMAEKKQVAIVSPDLHKREYVDFWKELKTKNFLNNPNIMICTDYPDQLMEMINE